MSLKRNYKPKPATSPFETTSETTVEKFFFPALLSSRAKQELLRLLLRKAASLEESQKASLPNQKAKKKAKKNSPSERSELYENLALLICLLFFVEEEGSTCLVLSKENLDSIKKRILSAYRLFAIQNELPGQSANPLPRKPETVCQDILDAQMKVKNLEGLCKAFPELIGTPEQATGLRKKNTKSSFENTFVAIPPIVFYNTSQASRHPKAESKKKKTATQSKGSKAFYFQKYLFYQAVIDAKLRSYRNGKARNFPHPLPNKDAIKNIIQQIQEESPLQKNGKKIQLDKAQVQSIEKSLQSPFLVITGGPGTGKTTIILSLLRAFVRAFPKSDPSRIALATPTGRSAQRLKEAIQEGLKSIEPIPKEDQRLLPLESQTLHKLLKLHPFRINKEKDALALDLLIIDEASMIDTRLFYELLRRIDPERTRIVLVGDADQLPSVDPGRILLDAIERTAGHKNSKNSFLSVLQTSHRSDSAIIQIAEQIKKGQVPNLPRTTDTKNFIESFLKKTTVKNQVLFLPAQANKEEQGHPLIPAEILRGWFSAFLDEAFFAALREWQEFLPSWEEIRAALLETQGNPSKNKQKANFQKLLSLLSQIHRSLQQFRILAFTRASVFSLNREGISFLSRGIYHRSPRHIAALPIGCPILIRQNDSDLELYNGDIGFLLSLSDGSQAAFFEGGSGRFRAIRKSSLPRHEAAFAHTVHKSQGSEYESVLLVLPNAAGLSAKDHPLLSREILYTGFTRAKKQVFLFGDEELLNYGVQKVHQRQSGPEILL